MAEKEVQVSLMGIIYSSAIKVLCHIGEETENSTIILDAMERYWKRNIRRGLVLGQGDSLMLSGESAAKLLDIPYPTDEEADAIEDVKGGEWPARYLEFISAPWFHRLWVVQEFVLGRHVLMIVGRRHIPWGRLWVGTLWFKGVKWPWDPVKFTNEDLVRLFTSYNSMCLVLSTRLIDLNTSHGRGFNNIAQVLLNGLEMNQTHAGGSLLLCAGLPGRAEEYPSWIRDLSAPKLMKHVWMGRPCFVQGYYIDDITDMSPNGASDPFNLVALALWIQEAFNFFTGPESSVGDSDPLYPLTSDPVCEAALKVMLDYNEQDTMSPDDEEFKALLRMGLSLPSVAFSKDAENKTTGEDAEETEATEEETIMGRIISGFQDERSTLWELCFRIHKVRGLGFYKTKKGLFALLPKFTRPGDSIWIIKGCGLPLVLRQSVTHHDSYELVGGGYVYGVMNGEMLEKPGFRWQEVSLR
ncbi:hypothetical protein J7337_010186 [Fusarium musae]|uniref:Heterokaryon incompatibility domain-containing protein n=1 Tax=Fusarium musae TaxID=1042133 RepID=A0A9P8DCQ4_9HYPO|nr:hypothetical protein J7337_010186 [Fusarium musae]KAG9499366.1 hypothetical protein J7337_010186 [Fusarium musae]